MLKKTFILIPIIMMFTACSDKNLALNNSEDLQQNVTSNSKLSYNEYKRMTEERNQKNKVKSHTDFKTVTTSTEYKSENILTSNEVEACINLPSSI